jgi:hypothetical protein
MTGLPIDECKRRNSLRAPTEESSRCCH